MTLQRGNLDMYCSFNIALFYSITIQILQAKFVLFLRINQISG